MPKISYLDLDFSFIEGYHSNPLMEDIFQTFEMLLYSIANVLRRRW